MTRDVFGDDVWRKLREAFEAAVIDAPVTEDGYGTSMHASAEGNPEVRCMSSEPAEAVTALVTAFMRDVLQLQIQPWQEAWQEERPPFDPSIFGTSPPTGVDRYARALREAEQHCHCDAAPSGYLTIREHSTMCPLYNF